jgi:hypothetical protein
MGIARHVETQDCSPVVAYYKEAIQNAKRERWDREEVHGGNGLAVVPEKRQPSLCGIWGSRDSPKPS